MLAGSDNEGCWRWFIVLVLIVAVIWIVALFSRPSEHTAQAELGEMIGRDIASPSKRMYAIEALRKCAETAETMPALLDCYKARTGR